MVKIENILLEFFGILLITLLGTIEFNTLTFNVMKTHNFTFSAYGTCSYYSFLPVYKAYTG